MNPELLALAYQLAVSPLRTDQMLREATETYHLSPEQATLVVTEIIMLRAPDDEFIVGDRVKFVHWGTGMVIIGKVTQAEWQDGQLKVCVTTPNGERHYTHGRRLMFYHGTGLFS